MANTPNAIKGRLLFVPDGKSTEDALELGELEIPLRIQVGTSGPATRGGGITPVLHIEPLGPGIPDVRDADRYPGNLGR